MKVRNRALPALLGLFAAAYLLPLGAAPLFTPDEFRYAEIPREMIAGGDWVVPRLNGLRYFEKPPMGYWLVGGSLSAFGLNPFAARLPSALSAGIVAFVVFLLAVKERAVGLPPEHVALYRRSSPTALFYLDLPRTPQLIEEAELEDFLKDAGPGLLLTEHKYAEEVQAALERRNAEFSRTEQPEEPWSGKRSRKGWIAWLLKGGGDRSDG